MKSIAIYMAVFGIMSSTMIPTAQACQGPQFETELRIFSNQEVKKISEDNIQFKIKLLEPKNWMQKYRSDFIFARVTEGEYANKTLIIKKPLITSCDRISLPAGKDNLYVSGQFARVNGTPMTIYGGLLFAIDPFTIKRTRGGIRQLIQPEDTAD